MDAEAWVRLNSLLDEALDLAPADRVRWLEALAPEDRPLKTRLISLLGHERSIVAAHFLDVLPSVDVAATEPPGESFDQPGATIGLYRLLREVGEGGMGTVWMAERTDGMLNRAVALKLPRGAWPRAALVERMARERNILAALTHPNIARLYDAGVSAGGRPYLALEYVEGQPIDTYCRAAQLDVRARVRVFLQVAHAVAYAHGQLIVHRDLKPSNILVNSDGQVRLLDFGIAKLLDAQTDQDTPLTELAGRPLTPEYSSPEQIMGLPLGVASDVYSLGVVLYELLAGMRPYKLRRDSRGALEDAILDTEPAPPSGCVTEMPVRKALRGDLDTIVLKALKKNPDDRYATVNALADDLQRYLAGRPVVARPDSGFYRVSKFVGRNRLAVAAAALLVVSLVAFGGVSAWQAKVLAEQQRVAQLERDSAEQVVRVLVDLFETTNPSIRPDGDRMPLGEFLSGAQARSLELLRDVPPVRAKLQQVFGLIDYTRGMYAPARDALEQALAEQRRLSGPDHPDSLESLQALGEIARYGGDAARSRELLEESLERHRRVYGEDHPKTARVLEVLAVVVGSRNIDEAGGMLQRALDIRRHHLAADHPDVARSLASLALYYTRRHDIEKARSLFEEAIAIARLPQNRRRSPMLMIFNDYSSALQSMKHHREAEGILREAIALGEEVVGPRSFSVANLVNSLGSTQASLGKYADGERSLRTAFELHRELLGDDHWRTRNVARNIGRLLELQQRYADALVWMDRAMVPARGAPAEDAGMFGIRAQRATLLLRLGRGDEALREATAAVNALQQIKSTDAARPLSMARVRLGRILVESGRAADAEPVLAAAVDYFGPTPPADDTWYAEASCELARARLLLRDRPDERVRLTQCLAVYRAWGVADPKVVASLERLQLRK